MSGQGEAPTPADADAALLFPATSWQLRHFRKATEAPEDPALNVAMRWTLSGHVSDTSTETALKALVRRHEILRTGFVRREGRLWQSVAADTSIRLATVDLQRLDETARQAEADSIGREEARAPFDVGAHGLVRALLVRLSPTRAILHLTFHHLIVDGWSVGSLIRELGQLAQAHEEGRAATLPDVDLHYGDYARWQESRREAGDFAGDLAWWRTRLDGVQPVTISPDTPHESGARRPSAIRAIQLDRTVSDALSRSTQVTGRTLFVTALAALAGMMHRITGADDITIGTQIAGRTEAEAETIVGPLLNTLVLRTAIAPGGDFPALQADIAARFQEALVHQAMPYDDLAMAYEADGLEEPYRINMILQRAYIDTDSASDSTFGRFSIESMPSHATGAQWDLNFFMVERGDGWRMSCEADISLYKIETVDLLLALWRDTLATVAADPAARIEDLPPPPASLRRPLSGGARRPAPHLPAQRRSARRERLLQRIIPLQRSGSRIPVMALNIASVLYPVAQAAGPDRAFYDLRLPPSDEPQSLPMRAFTDVARDAVEMIRLVRPNGPYILFGLCVCGSLAIEAARQLRDDGEEVPLVVLADSWMPGYREQMGWLDRQKRLWIVRRQRWQADHKACVEGRQSLSTSLSHYPLLRALGLDAFARAFLDGPNAPPPPDVRHEIRWFADYMAKVQASHRPEPYDGKALIFRSEEVLNGRLFARDFGWRGVISDLHVLDCPGQHATMFREAGAAVIGAAIRDAMNAFGEK